MTKLTEIKRLWAIWASSLLSSLLLCFTVYYAMYRWSFYFMLPLFLLIIVAPLFILFEVALVVLIYTKGRQWHIIPPLPVSVLLGVILFMVGWYAPIYSKQYGLEMSSHFIDTLGIRVALVHQTVQMESMYNDIAPPRHIQSVYVPLEPIAAIEKKLKENLLPEAGWAFVQKGDTELWMYKVSRWGFFCGTEHIGDGRFRYTGFDNSLVLDETGNLTVTLYYGSRPECRLQPSK